MNNIQSVFTGSVAELASMPPYTTQVIFEADPVILSCARQRIQNDTGTYLDLGDVKNVHIIDADRIKGIKIRESYMSKLTLAALSDGTCSVYRKTLGKYLVSSNPNIIDIDIQKIIHKLPEQYDYDCAIDEMREQFFNRTYTDQSLIGEKELIPVKRLIRKTSKNKSHVYWFKTSDTSAPVTMEIETSNVLVSMFNHVFDTFSHLKISGKYYWKESRDNFNFFKLSHWGLNSKIIEGD